MSELLPAGWRTRLAALLLLLFIMNFSHRDEKVYIIHLKSRALQSMTEPVELGMSVEELEERYRELRSRYPKLPAELRPFQVSVVQLTISVTNLAQIDVIRALLDPSHQQHVLLAVPTGGGKTLPQLVVPLLSPEGNEKAPCTWHDARGTMHVTPCTWHH